MDSFIDRHRAAVLALAAALPFVWCTVAERLGDAITTTTSALVLVLLVVAAAATGDRLAGIAAAASGSAWFDFFLTAPTRTFEIDNPDNIEVAVLLVLVGAAVTEIALWGLRQQASSSTRAGYLAGVASTSQIAAGQLPATELVNQVTTSITKVLEVDACRFVNEVGSRWDSAVLEPDGSVTFRDKTVNVERDGLPTMDETALPARHHGTAIGQFLITASTEIAHPTLEQRQVAVVLANVVGAELASRHPIRRSDET